MAKPNVQTLVADIRGCSRLSTRGGTGRRRIPTDTLNVMFLFRPFGWGRDGDEVFDEALAVVVE